MQDYMTQLKWCTFRFRWSMAMPQDLTGRWHCVPEALIHLLSPTSSILCDYEVDFNHGRLVIRITPNGCCWLLEVACQFVKLLHYQFAVLSLPCTHSLAITPLVCSMFALLWRSCQFHSHWPHLSSCPTWTPHRICFAVWNSFLFHTMLNL